MYKVYYQAKNHPLYMGKFKTTSEAIDYIATENEKDLIEMAQDGDYNPADDNEKWSIWNENINRYVIIKVDDNDTGEA